MEEKRQIWQLKKPSVDVIIPTYRPGRDFSCLLKRLKQQTFALNRLIVINTEEQYWDARACAGMENIEVLHVSKKEFDHGGTRNLGAAVSAADVMIFMTDDAVPRGKKLVERLVEALYQKGPQGETIAMAYARQLPRKDSRPVERCIRGFNYSGESCVKTSADLPVRGIKTYFASNVCCAYRKEIFEEHYFPIMRHVLLDGLERLGYGEIELMNLPAFVENVKPDEADWYCVLARKQEASI